VGAQPEAASATGAAFDGTVSIVSGTATAQAGVASGTGAAYNPRVSTHKAIDHGGGRVLLVPKRVIIHRAHAEVAEGSGEAADGRGRIRTGASIASGEGAALGVVARLAAPAQCAAGEGEAFDTTVEWNDDEFALELLVA
jgi:hypothetical protein